MLRLILGKSGSGKTFYLYNKVKEYIDNSEERELFFIVPEQNTFNTETELLEFLGAENYKNINVLSISRLAAKLIRKNKKSFLTPITAAGKHLLMSLTLNRVKDKLKIFNSSVNKPDFINMMLQVSENFKIRSITTKELYDVRYSVGDKILRNKIEDVALIIDAFDAMLTQSYIDPSDNIKRLYEIVSENKTFKNTIVFFDSFTGFTPIENLLIEEIIKQTDESFFALNADEKSQEDSIFITSNNTVGQLKEFAFKNNVKVAKPYIVDYKNKKVSEEISNLKESLFNEDYSFYENKTDDIILYSSDNFYNECEFVSQKIKEYIKEKNYRYDDFIIVGRNENKISGVISNIFKKYEIPYFMDKRAEIHSSALFTFVLSALQCITENFKENHLFKMLKTGLTDISLEEVDLFENYVFMWKIDGKAFLDEFTENPNGLGNKHTKETEKTLKRLNEIREKAITPLLKLKNTKDLNGEKIARAIYELILDYKVIEGLGRLKNSYENENSYKAKELSAVWDAFIELLDQTSLILKDTEITISEYTMLFNLLIDDIDVGALPQGKDRVIVATAGRSRLKKAKITFVIGANEGVFPETPTNGGLFNDDECIILSRLDIKIADDINEMNLSENYFAYTALVSPVQKLFVTYSKFDLLGKELKPSVIVKEIQKIYPNTTIIERGKVELEDTIWSEKQGFEIYGKSNKKTVLSATLKKYYSESHLYSDMIKGIENAEKHKIPHLNDSNLINKLYGSELVLSPTRIETFHMCKFQYFCNYVISLKNNKKAEFDSIQYGNFIHYVLENFLKNYSINELSSYSEEKIEALSDALIDEYIEVYLGGKEKKSARFLALCKKISLVIKELINHMIAELSQSAFVPTDFELVVGKEIPAYKIKSENGRLISVKGKIDRVDIMTLDNEEKYVRIIDYKTGAKAFKLSDVLVGLNMQMLLYLVAITSKGNNRYGENVIPAGILYLPASVTDTLTNRNITDENKNIAINKMLAMNGIILNDSRVIYGMENKAEGIYIPIKIKDEKITDRNGFLINADEFKLIFKKIENVLKEMDNELQAGNIENIPLHSTTFNACEWCVYNTICGFQKGDKCRELFKLTSNKDVIKMLKQEKEQGDE